MKHTTQEAGGGETPISHQLTYAALLVLGCTPFLVAGFWQVEPTVAPTEIANPYAIEQAHPHTLPLLSAAISSQTADGRGGAELQVADGALIATGGPLSPSDFAESGSSEIRVYTVREGDTLSMVAEMFGVTTNTILWANDLPRATQIQPDDTLIILPVAGVQHKVGSGDSLSVIAEKYDVNAEEILSFNQLSDANELAIGDKLIIPGGTIKSVQARAASARPVKISGSVTEASAGLIHPVPGAIRTQGIHGNNAVDFAAGHGASIRAAAAGEVIVSKSSGWNGGYGQYIVVRHNNGTQTLYSHLSQNYVGVGAYVAQGEAIGAMGNTGRSTGTHLHFEVRGARNPF